MGDGLHAEQPTEAGKPSLPRLPRMTREGLRKRLLEASDLAAVSRARRRVESLEVAVAENAEMAVALEAQVTRLEEMLVAVMERDGRREEE